MKNRILLIIAVLMIASGVALLSVNAAVYGGEWYKVDFSTDDSKAETMIIEDSFDSIDIASGSCDVVLMPSKDGKCSVTAPQGTNLKTRCEIEVNAKTGEKTLCIFIEDKSEWYEHITFSTVRSAAKDIIVRLPEREYNKLSIVNGSGKTEVPRDFKFRTAEITNASGSIEFYASVNDILSLYSVSGSVKAKNGDCNIVEVNSTSGHIELSDIRCRSLTISSVSGHIEVEDSYSAETEISSVSGSIELEDFDTEELSVETVSGSLTIPKKLKPVTEYYTTSGTIRYE